MKTQIVHQNGSVEHKKVAEVYESDHNPDKVNVNLHNGDSKEYKNTTNIGTYTE